MQDALLLMVHALELLFWEIFKCSFCCFTLIQAGTSLFSKYTYCTFDATSSSFKMKNCVVRTDSIPLLQASFQSHSASSVCQCVFREILCHLINVSIQFLLCTSWNLLDTCQFSQQLFIFFCTRILEVSWRFWHLTLNILRWINLLLNVMHDKRCSINRLTIAAFLVVIVANIAPIFSRAKFSSLSASSCHKDKRRDFSFLIGT